MSQRRMPMSEYELQEFQRTKQFPLMSDPIKRKPKTYCSDCTFWNRINLHQGTCSNESAYKYAFLGDEKLGTPERLITGSLCTCPEFQPQSLTHDTP